VGAATYMRNSFHLLCICTAVSREPVVDLRFILFEGVLCTFVGVALCGVLNQPGLAVDIGVGIDITVDQMLFSPSLI
jgi:hypothetical protein